MKKIAIASLLLLTAFGSYWFFLNDELPESNDEEELSFLSLSEQQLSDAGIVFAKVKSEIVEQTIPVYGKVTVIPDHHCHITSNVAGIVRKAFKNLGDPVAQGETIAIIESKELAEIQAQYHILEGKVNFLQMVFDKESKLSQKNLITDEVLFQALTALQEAEIEKRLVEQKMNALGISPNKPSIYEVKAPIKGTIVKRLITLGEVVSSGTELYEIANLKQVWGEFSAYSQDIHLFDTDKEIFLSDNSKATISYISPMLDETTGAIAVLANIDNSQGNYRPGSPLSGKLIANRVELASCVPSEAIVMIEDIPHIFVSHEEGIEPRKISLGHLGDNYSEVIAGLEGGEEIVIKNASLLKCELTKQEPD